MTTSSVVLNKKVAVIDDNEELCALLKMFLQDKGYDVTVYSTSELFLSHVTNNPHLFDLILLDLFMPDPDGIRVIRALAEQHFPGSILLMSGEDQGVLRAALELAKAQHLCGLSSIAKPFSLDVMASRVDELLSRNVSQSTPKYAWNPEPSDVLNAIQSRQFDLYYQPKIQLEQLTTCGFEALLRWKHPQHGLIMPDRFIQMVETSCHLMQALTEEVIRIAIEQLVVWKEQGKTVVLSINVSMLNLVRLDFPEFLQNLLLERQLTTSQLQLEVTETALMNEVATSLDILLRLKMKGFCLSIDDFGTGYSSLAQLHRIPFSELKIDRSFVMTMHSCSESRAIVDTCIKLGKRLGLKVVAEGVETEAILHTLIEMGCDIGQGYFCSKAVPSSETKLWL
jgi:EAL domain-containing protein (putative c-di-GMP-specific phosphodiesterase class I)